MKLDHDFWQFRFYKMQVEQIISDYEKMRKTRENIQAKYFDLLAELAKNDFIEGGIDAHKWSVHREQEDLVWNAEMMLLDEIEDIFNQGLELIKSGKAEELLIDEESR